MENRRDANGQAATTDIEPGAPAKKETIGNPNDPRWLAGDKIEEDNEIKRGVEPGDKKDKTGR